MPEHDGPGGGPDPLDTARTMWADDPASRALGIELLDLDLGRVSPDLKGMQVALNVSNLFNKEYFASCWSTSFCYYGYQRSVRASLRYRW